MTGLPRWLKLKANWRSALTPLIYGFAAVVGAVVADISASIDEITMGTAATNLISMASFLAAASGVLVAIYLGQVLKGIPAIVEKTLPVAEESQMNAIAQKLEELLSQSKTKEDKKKALMMWTLKFVTHPEASEKYWNKVFSNFLRGAKLIRLQGVRALYQLVASALVSVLAIITGAPFLLGLSVSLIIVATWSIMRSWSAAEETIKDALMQSWIVSKPTESTSGPRAADATVR